MRSLLIFIKDHRVSQKLSLIPKGTIATTVDPPYVKIVRLEENNTATIRLLIKISLKSFLPYPFTVPFGDVVRFLGEKEIMLLRGKPPNNGRKEMLIPHDALKNMHLRPKKVQIVCQLAGNICNICSSHIHDGDVVCPEGHRHGQLYLSKKEVETTSDL